MDFETGLDAAQDLEIVGAPAAADIDHHGHGNAGEQRQLVEPSGDARVLQADGVDHARRGLGDARRRVAGARFQRHRLGHVSGERKRLQGAGAEAAGGLEGVEGPRGIQDGMLERHAGERDGQVGAPGLERRRQHPASTPPPSGSPVAAGRSSGNTGPSTQTRR